MCRWNVFIWTYLKSAWSLIRNAIEILSWHLILNCALLRGGVTSIKFACKVFCLKQNKIIFFAISETCLPTSIIRLFLEFHPAVTRSRDCLHIHTMWGYWFNCKQKVCKQTPASKSVGPSWIIYIYSFLNGDPNFKSMGTLQNVWRPPPLVRKKVCQA